MLETRLIPGLGLLVVLSGFAAQSHPQESVQEIMSRVAENQDRAQELRSAFVYRQSLLLRFKRGNGKLTREELREYTVTPTATGTEKVLRHFLGKYESKGKIIDYDEPGHKYKDMDIDGEIISDLAEDIADEKESKDGIAMDLFPLTSKQQKKYSFTLKGREDYRGKEVFRITFKPIKTGWIENDGLPWSGEILVDTRDCQPVLVSTRLAKGIPFWVKTLLGTNVRNLGLKLVYEKFDEDLWFPVSCSGECELRAAFFYKRKMAIALSNSGFQRAQVATTVTFEDPLTIDELLKVREIKPQSSPPKP